MLFSLACYPGKGSLANGQVSGQRKLFRSFPQRHSLSSASIHYAEEEFSSSKAPSFTVHSCKGDTLIDYKLFSVADLDITSSLPDYIDMCFYYVLICASRNNSFLLFSL